MVFPLAALPVGSHALYLTCGPLEPALCFGMLYLLCALAVNCKQLLQGIEYPKVYKQPGKGDLSTPATSCCPSYCLKSPSGTRWLLTLG